MVITLYSASRGATLSRTPANINTGGFHFIGCQAFKPHAMQSAQQQLKGKFLLQSFMFG